MDINVSSESTIENIFSNFLILNGETYQFSIPLYQREYSWGEEQWRETFADLIHSLNKPDMDTDYWGNIIVYKNDLTIGGVPCPGFSEAGPRLIDDERNFLYIHFIRELVQTQPLFFVAENVKGMMTLGKGEVLRQIIEDFSSAGYTVTAYLVNARDYGVPQSRERVFLIGVHKEKTEEKFGYHYELPLPTHGSPEEIDLITEKLPWVTLKEAIGDLENNPGEYFEGSYSTIYMSRNRKKSWDEQTLISFIYQRSWHFAKISQGAFFDVFELVITFLITL